MEEPPEYDAEPFDRLTIPSPAYSGVEESIEESVRCIEPALEHRKQ
jgi:hypothetical protein